MPATIETHGEIEIRCDVSDLRPGRQAKLVFRTYHDDPPYQIRVYAPSGSLILERVVRELPTGEPQSAPPVSFGVHEGTYKITLSHLGGKTHGEAVLTVRK